MKWNWKNKRGYEISVIAGIAITFLVIAIILSFGGTIVDDLGDDVGGTTTETVNNETITSATQNTTSQIAACISQLSSSVTLTGFMNASGGDSANATHANSFLNTTDGNLTSDGLFTLSGAAEDAGFGATSVNITYTCTYGDGNAAFNSTELGQEGLQEFSSWLPTLALIIIAAVIIGIITRYFGFGGGR
jgi:hypothetical protein|tara:strand:- start:677 stop:1246 length:570 start_codon:yes stop_codon:yes gene_type:complete